MPDTPRPIATLPVAVAMPPINRAQARRLIAVYAGLLIVLTLIGHANVARMTRTVLAIVAEEGNREVFIGGGGWLFDRAELAALHGPGPRKLGNSGPVQGRDVILDVAAQLKQRGVPLLLVSVPSKATIYPEFISRLIRKPLFHASQAALYEQFRAAGIDVLDLTQTLWDLKIHKQVFLQQDSHWTPDTMEFVSDTLVKHIRKKYPQALQPADIAGIVDPRPAERSSEGNLARRLDLAWSQHFFPREEVLIVSRNGLDADERSPLALLGGSFVRIFDDPALGFAPEDEADSGKPMCGGLAHKLAFALNQRLDVITSADGESAAAPLMLARRADEAVRAKKLVIWVIAARDLFLYPAAAREAGVNWKRVSFGSQEP